MQTITLTAEMLGAIAGILISLALAYIPGLHTRFQNLDSDVKRLILGILLLAATVAIALLDCGGVISTGIACDKFGVWQYVSIFIMAIIGNQTAYTTLPTRRK